MTAEAKRTNSKSSWSTCSGWLARRALPCCALQPLGGFEILAAEGVQLVLGQNVSMAAACSGVRSVYWSSWVCSLLHFLEMLDEGGAGVVALEVGHVFGLASRGLATS